MAFPTYQRAANLEFAVKHNWGIRFLDESIIPDKDFRDIWFPANSLDLDLYKLSLYAVNTNMSSFSVPLRNEIGNLDLTVMFYDLQNSLLEDWMRTWVNRIHPRNGFGAPTHVSRLSDSFGTVEITRLNGRKQILNRPITGGKWIKKILIIPEGNLKLVGESVTGLLTYSQQFKIVGGSVKDVK